MNTMQSLDVDYINKSGSFVRLRYKIGYLDKWLDDIPTRYKCTQLTLFQFNWFKSFP